MNIEYSTSYNPYYKIFYRNIKIINFRKAILK